MSNTELFEKAKKKSEEINSDLIRNQGFREQLDSQITQFREKLFKTYGTDDIEKLKKDAERISSSNNEKREAYINAVRAVEGDVARIKANYQN